MASGAAAHEGHPFRPGGLYRLAHASSPSAAIHATHLGGPTVVHRFVAHTVPTAEAEECWAPFAALSAGACTELRVRQADFRSGAVLVWTRVPPEDDDDDDHEGTTTTTTPTPTTTT